MSDHGPVTGMLSRSQLMDIALAAQMSVPVLVSGDTGTRRRACARAIHDACVREKRPFVAISCRATPGAPDGQWDGVAGGSDGAKRASLTTWFQRAQRGTLFIDALEHMSPELQDQLVTELDLGILRRAEPQSAVRLITGARPGWPRGVDGPPFAERLFYRLNIMRVDCMPIPHSNPLVVGQEQDWALRSVPATRRRSTYSLVSDGLSGRTGG